MNSCKKFGVTFHKNMDLQTLVDQWDKVSEEDKQSDPSFNDLMKSTKNILDAQAAQIQVTQTAKEALDTITEITIVASAVLTGNAAYAGTKSSEIAAESAQAAQNNALEIQQQLIFDQLCEE